MVLRKVLLLPALAALLVVLALTSSLPVASAAAARAGATTEARAGAKRLGAAVLRRLVANPRHFEAQRLQRLLQRGTSGEGNEGASRLLVPPFDIDLSGASRNDTRPKCVPCQAGNYSDHRNCSMCAPGFCPPHLCSICPPGTYSNHSQAEFCDLCDEGEPPPLPSQNAPLPPRHACARSRPLAVGVLLMWRLLALSQPPSRRLLYRL